MEKALSNSKNYYITSLLKWKLSPDCNYCMWIHYSCDVKIDIGSMLRIYFSRKSRPRKVSPNNNAHCGCRSGHCFQQPETAISISSLLRMALLRSGFQYSYRRKASDQGNRAFGARSDIQFTNYRHVSCEIGLVAT